METATIAREWIASEFSKGIAAEQNMAVEAKDRAQSPPEADLGVVYHEIAVADERHRSVVETIAVRYGHNPSRSLSGGIGEAIGRFKERVGEMGTRPQEKVAHDLATKADAIHWYEAWIHAFEEIGDGESARELAAVCTEEKAHRDALQQWLNRIVARGAKGETYAEAHGA